MIHFFRRIRQKLLTNNQMKKYFLYAIGEIALVMIGILFALQINNWNQNRLNDGLEIDYLNRLHADIQRDTAVLHGNIDASIKKRTFLQSISDKSLTTLNNKE